MKKIYMELRSRILNEILSPGQKISEISLAREFNCSRTPIRDVLKRLELDGLVIIKPKSGTYVKHETMEDLIEIMQVRSSLERLAFRQACSIASESDIYELDKIKKDLDRLSIQEPIDMIEFAQRHYDFHYRIICISGNKLLKKYFERLNLRSSHMFYKYMDKNIALETQTEHQQIVDKMREHDLDGCEFMENLLQKKIEIYRKET
jgi:DNA-binding GntR family transcriptional regulator